MNLCLGLSTNHHDSLHGFIDIGGDGEDWMIGFWNRWSSSSAREVLSRHMLGTIVCTTSASQEMLVIETFCTAIHYLLIVTIIILHEHAFVILCFNTYCYENRGTSIVSFYLLLTIHVLPPILQIRPFY